MKHFKLSEALDARSPTERTFRIETNSGNFFFNTDSLDIARTLVDPCTVHEIINGAQHIFFDIDIINCDSLDDNKVCAELGRVIVAYFLRRDILPDINYFTSSVAGVKTSIHAIVSNVYVENAVMNKCVCLEIVKNINSELMEHIDTQVWRNNGSLRVPGSAKLSDPSRIKRLLRGDNPNQLVSVLNTSGMHLVYPLVMPVPKKHEIKTRTVELVYTFDDILRHIEQCTENLEGPRLTFDRSLYTEGQTHEYYYSNIVQIMRLRPTYCLICERIHGTERCKGDNMWVYISSSVWRLHCHRADKSRFIRIK